MKLNATATQVNTYRQPGSHVQKGASFRFEAEGKKLTRVTEGNGPTCGVGGPQHDTSEVHVPATDHIVHRAPQLLHDLSLSFPRGFSLNITAVVLDLKFRMERWYQSAYEDSLRVEQELRRRADRERELDQQCLSLFDTRWHQLAYEDSLIRVEEELRRRADKERGLDQQLPCTPLDTLHIATYNPYSLTWPCGVGGLQHDMSEVPVSAAEPEGVGDEDISDSTL